SWYRRRRWFSWAGELADLLDSRSSTAAGEWSVLMTTSSEAPTAIPADRHRRKLLILESDRALRRELEQVFSDLDVTVSETSEQALVLIRRIEPDVVLFDFGAAREPSVGQQSLVLLRQILTLAPDTKIIAMTEHDARELAVAAVGLGAADFYHKPI